MTAIRCLPVVKTDGHSPQGSPPPQAPAFSPCPTTVQAPDFLQTAALQPLGPGCEQRKHFCSQFNREMGLFACVLHAVLCPNFEQIFQEFCQGGHRPLLSAAPGMSLQA